MTPSLSKAIITKVEKSGFKGDYGKNIISGSFIRTILGLVHCPLDRFKEAIRKIYNAAKKLAIIRQQVCLLLDQLRPPVLGEWRRRRRSGICSCMT